MEKPTGVAFEPPLVFLFDIEPARRAAATADRLVRSSMICFGQARQRFTTGWKSVPHSSASRAGMPDLEYGDLRACFLPLTKPSGAFEFERGAPLS
jgi:hypothetical protein